MFLTTKGDEHDTQFKTIMTNNRAKSNHSNNDNEIGLIKDDLEIRTPAISDTITLKVECSIG